MNVTAVSIYPFLQVRLIYINRKSSIMIFVMWTSSEKLSKLKPYCNPSVHKNIHAYLDCPIPKAMPC